MGKQLPVIQSNYFRCDPHELCEGAACCSGIESQPTVTLGDYFRLSNYTGEPMYEIWHSKGDVYLVERDEVHHLLLSLFHEPCPYLKGDLRCGVYESRPSICATFPVGLLRNHADQIETYYKDYRCLRDVQLSPDQIALKEKIAVVKYREDDLESEMLWKSIGGPFYFKLSDPVLYATAADIALSNQAFRDPALTSPRSQRLAAAITKTLDLCKGAKGQVYFDGNKWRELMYPVIFALVEDKVGERLRQLADKMEPFIETSRQMTNLLKA